MSTRIFRRSAGKMMIGFLLQAERLYGSRDANWRLEGIQVHDLGPRLWFPVVGENRIEIEVSPSATDDPDIAAFQIAHEVIHLLAPIQAEVGAEFMPASALEEGLAVHFSLCAPRYSSAAKAIQLETTLPDTYRAALALYRSLEGICPDAVRHLRSIRPNFFDMDEVFLQTELTIPASLARALVQSNRMR